MSGKTEGVKKKITKLKRLGLDIEAVSNYVYEAKNDAGQSFCIGISQLEIWPVNELYETVINYWKGCGKKK